MKKKYGFSIIELLITVAIIGILMALSIPLYTHYILEEERIEAQVILENMAAALEDYFALNNTYENATLVSLNTPEYTAHHHYQLRIKKATATEYIIQAVSLDNNDTSCGTLSLNNTLEKGITGTGTINDCW
jgi:type IV pilus assembly protein PilE